MKIKILTTELDKQLILKPEDEFEKDVCKMFESMPNTFRGDFDECKGGYFRNFSHTRESGDDLIIRFSSPVERTIDCDEKTKDILLDVLENKPIGKAKRNIKMGDIVYDDDLSEAKNEENN